MALLSMFVAPSSGIHAQDAVRAPASSLVRRPGALPPDSVPVVLRAISREPMPAAIAQLPRHGPLTLPVAQFMVVAATAWSNVSTLYADSADDALFRCAVSSGLADSSARRLVRERPWRAFDVEASASPYVVFQVMPLALPVPGCARERLRDTGLLARGILFTDASSFGRGSDITDVDVVVSSSFVAPSMYGRVPVAVTDWLPIRGSAAERPAPPRQVRVYVPMDAIAPQGGVTPHVSLRIWTENVNVVSVPIPDDIAGQLWRELVPWRLERVRAAVSGLPAGDLPALPTPGDATLQRAVEDYRGGKVVEGAERAAAWQSLHQARRVAADADASLPARDDRLIASVMVGGVLAAGGDSVAAAPLIDDALTLAPCLVPSTPSAGAFARVVSARRPRVRCATRPTDEVWRRGLMYPGGGHAAAGDKSAALVAASIVTAALGGAVAATIAASHRYDRYQSAHSVERAQHLYDGAVSMRWVARGLALGAAVAWLSDGRIAVAREKRRARVLRAQQLYGRDSCTERGARGCPP